jgi:hypothetical protein
LFRIFKDLKIVFSNFEKSRLPIGVKWNSSEKIISLFTINSNMSNFDTSRNINDLQKFSGTEIVFSKLFIFSKKSRVMIFQKWVASKYKNIFLRFSNMYDFATACINFFISHLENPLMSDFSIEMDLYSK